jgi:response regulator NasT
LEIEDVGPLSRQTEAEVALVGLGLDGDHALDLITSIVHEAACPVIALLDTDDPAYVNEAAKRGVFAYVIMNGADHELQSALDITLRRFAEFSNLQGAFGRRAIIEQAKGVLMARNGIDADQAFQILKAHSQQTGRRLVHVAEAVTQSHQLLDRSTTE